MKIVNFGDEFRIFPDDLKTYDLFPAGTYKVTFNPMSGFALTKIHDFELMEEKTYGTHPERIEKILKAYAQFERSLGVIFSGDKGMGKSLSIQLLAKAGVERGLPVIMVPKAYKGVADFIESIDQEALVIFDEFEKVFPLRNTHGQQGNSPLENQDELLGLFDGTSQRKRMYVITVNHLHQVSEFMVSRTGRFHYHIRFDYPTAEEIEIYLRDKVEEQYYGEIKHVVAFSTRVKLNYDSLRAIAFEINMGYPFRSAISDLNILSTDRQQYDVKITFVDGKTTTINKQHMNLFADANRLDGCHENQYFSLTFDSSSIQTNGSDMVVDGKHVQLHAHDEEGDDTDDVQIASILIKQHYDSGVNFKMRELTV